MAAIAKNVVGLMRNPKAKDAKVVEGERKVPLTEKKSVFAD